MKKKWKKSQLENEKFYKQKKMLVARLALLQT